MISLKQNRQIAFSGGSERVFSYLSSMIARLVLLPLLMKTKVKKCIFRLVITGRR